MNTIDAAKKYLNKSFIGFNVPGQCVALINRVILDTFGLKYPLLGARTARELMKTQNTRPDLFEIVVNNPKDPNQLPSPGDFFVKGKGWGGWNKDVKDWNGHTGVINVVGTSSFTSIDQNFSPNKVTEQVHDYNNMDGWIHIKDKGDNMNRGDIINLYRVVLDRDADEGGIATYLGKSWKEVFYALIGSSEYKNHEDQEASTLAQLRTALENEKSKPPKEVVKEIEKIVEKVVVVEPSWVGKVRDFILRFLKKEK